jgi:hypothetical protein
MHAAKTDWEALQRILIVRVSTSSVSIDPESTALSDCGNQACLFRKTRLATFASIQQSIILWQQLKREGHHRHAK